MIIQQQVSAAYHLQVCEGDKVIHDSGEIDNLITDYALTLANPFTSGFLCVGTGNTAPEEYDLKLEDEVKATAASFDKNNAEIFMKDGKRYSKVKCYAEFTGITQSIREVGFKIQNNASTLVSRTLIRDGNGQLTEIPLRAEQVLKISYYVYILIPDVISSGEVSGPYGKTYYELRPYDGMTKPMGIFAANFAEPLNGIRLSLKIKDVVQKVEAGTTAWINIPEEQKITGTVNFGAVNDDRFIERIEAHTNPANYFAIYFPNGLLFNPEESDIGFTINIVWGREGS